MRTYVVYIEATGQLVSVGTVLGENLDASLAVTEFDSVAGVLDPAVQEWDAETRSVVSVAEPVEETVED